MVFDIGAISGELSTDPEQVFYVGLFFGLYLIGVAGSTLVLRVGKLSRDDWILVFTPVAYYFLIPLHGVNKDANVDVLWSLTFQWTIPAATVGFVIGGLIKRTKSKPTDSNEDDEL
jgi:hypothetical protein